jgi:hypothetical protein
MLSLTGTGAPGLDRCARVTVHSSFAASAGSPVLDASTGRAAGSLAAYPSTRDDPVGVGGRHPPGQEAANQMQATGSGVDLGDLELADPVLNKHPVVALDHVCAVAHEDQPLS